MNAPDQPIPAEDITGPEDVTNPTTDAGAARIDELTGDNPPAHDPFTEYPPIEEPTSEGTANADPGA